MLTTRGIFIPLALLVATLAPAMAKADTPSPGDIPDNQAFVRFTTPGYSLVAPEGWARTTNGARSRSTDKYNSISIEIIFVNAQKRLR